ncbi:MAG: hypothetical protein LBL30_03355 [Holosporales bacterium]|nr:hypothetical protein [Holosporales bacterium]
MVKRLEVIPDLSFLSNNGINFKDIANYFAYAMQKGIPPIVIFGSGRGVIMGSLGFDCYRYLRPYNYLLVNWTNNPAPTERFPLTLPDVDCDIHNFSPESFGIEKYRYVIVEGFNAFSPSTFTNLFVLLQPGGSIVTNVFPRLLSAYSDADVQPYLEDTSFTRVEVTLKDSNYVFFYKQPAGTFRSSDIFLRTPSGNTSRTFLQDCEAYKANAERHTKRTPISILDS